MWTKQWHEKKESDKPQAAANCIEEEHKNIIDEMSKLDKLSDCSVEVPQESAESTLFDSMNYVAIYKSSV